MIKTENAPRVPKVIVLTIYSCNQCPHHCVPFPPSQTLYCNHPKARHSKECARMIGDHFSGVPNWCPLEDRK